VYLLGVAATGPEQDRAEQPLVAEVGKPGQDSAPLQDCNDRTPTFPARIASMP
jgi:hypothetical protein